MKVLIVLNCGLYSKTGKWVLSQKMVQIQDIFKNGKPNIVLKTVMGFNIKSTPFITLILENIENCCPRHV